MNIFKTSRTQGKKTSFVSVQESYSIWKLLDNRYRVVNYLNLMNNFVHDLDFKSIMNGHLLQYEKEIKLLENLAEQFSIKGPRPNTHKIKMKGNMEIIRDRELAWSAYRILSAELGTMMKILRDTTTNDSVRDQFMEILYKLIDMIFDFLDYLTLKGWMSPPPLYPYVPDNQNKRIATNEVYYLWQHLLFRYNAVHITKIYSSYVYDMDLKVIFDIGNRELAKQTTKLENTLEKYGVNLPQPYSRVIPTPEATEVFSDGFMFWDVLSRMQNAAALHSQAVVDTIINSEVRNIFKELIFTESNIINRLIKYGKVKGWMPLEPHYKMV